MAQLIAVARGSALQKMHYGSPLIKIMSSYCGSQSGYYRRVFGNVKVPAVAQASACVVLIFGEVRSKAHRLKPVLLKPLRCIRAKNFQSSTSPRRIPRETASVRLDAPSLPSIEAT